MIKDAPVILLDFNELTPALVERFTRARQLPNFDRFYRESRVFTTDAEEAQDKLNPWIQWVTVHSGLSFAEHGVFHLGDGHKLKRKCVWDLLSDAGLPVPWTTTVAPYPDELVPYFRFVQRNGQEHTNDHVPLAPADHARFVAFMVRHGLSARTVSSIARQLMRERLAGKRWKRAVLLD